ncbi:MAG: hypothetical protein C3F11_17470 [Methylocystaceae bacterium]|nr:MAG: hypothetical protein C3F11_17470 [Methylocystaceae bacterium]
MRHSSRLAWAAAIAIGGSLDASSATSALTVASPPQKHLQPFVREASWLCGSGWQINSRGRCQSNWRRLLQRRAEGRSMSLSRGRKACASAYRDCSRSEPEGLTIQARP